MRRTTLAALAALAFILLAAGSQNQKAGLLPPEASVIIGGEKFPGFTGADIQSLGLSSASGLVPFQVDEKNSGGEYCLQVGEAASADDLPGLDPNDEIVFMAKDLGPRCAPPHGAIAAAEIEVLDPATGARGYAWLARFPGKAPHSNRDYLHFEPAAPAGRWRVCSNFYCMSGDEGKYLPDILAPNLSRDARRPRPGPDLVDRIKVRMMVTAPLGLQLNFNFQDIVTARFTAWTDGPVRVLIFNDTYMGFSEINLGGGGRAVIEYHPYGARWPVEFDLPNPRLLVRELAVEAYMDFSPAAAGAVFWNEANPDQREFRLDGKLSPAERTMDQNARVEWVAGVSEQGAIVCRIEMPPAWRGTVNSTSLFTDDADAIDPPEEFPGVMAPGFRLTRFERLPNFRGYYYLNMYLSETADEAAAERLLRQKSRPLETYIK